MKLDYKLLLILILALALILSNLFQCNQSKQDRTVINLLNEQVKTQDSLIQIRTQRIDSLLNIPAKIKYKYATKKDSIPVLSADSIDKILRSVTRD